MSQNPLLAPWDAPFGLPPFAAIEPGHFDEAFEAALAAHRAELAEITANPTAASFANTVEPLERAGHLLSRVSRTLDTLAANVATDALEAVELAWSPRLAAHWAGIMADAALFARIDAIHAARHTLGLEEDQRRLVEQWHRQMRRAGAALPEADRARMQALAGELSHLETSFAQNVTRAERDWVLTLAEADLDGLSPASRASLKAAAEERGLPGYAVTLSRTAMEDFLSQSARRDLRQKVHAAWWARGEATNAPLVRQILALRAERARLLGAANYADFAVEGSMAATPAAAMRLLNRLWEAGKRRAAEEQAELEKEAAADGLNGSFEPWDWRYYAERVRKRLHGLDEAALKPYLSLQNVLNAAFDTANRLFGLTFEERQGLPGWHPDMRAFEVKENGETIGLFLMDNFARPGKRSGAWMSSLAEAARLTGERPVVTNDNNIARGNPTLLTWDDARTVFHELGHGLHGLLSKVRYPSQSGTSVEHDFVEFPSQVFENWLATEAVLQKHARHHETGEPMPAELLKSLLAAQNFNQGFLTTELIGSAILDMELHAEPKPESIDPEAFQEALLTRLGMPKAVGLRHRLLHFSHLFGGSMYAAGYYAYLWAQVLDADGFEAFEETGDVFNPALAAKLKTVLESGGARDPMALYKSFRGREPAEDALLRARGLVH
ncbi:M3 family metallopeptidase [Acetobacteraceae bacterium H6797]|nr:M3 family metallopeptidase [Acetobacteraceae bacterium H6797]